MTLHHQLVENERVFPHRQIAKGSENTAPLCDRLIVLHVAERKLFHNRENRLKCTENLYCRRYLPAEVSVHGLHSEEVKATMPLTRRNDCLPSSTSKPTVHSPPMTLSEWSDTTCLGYPVYCEVVMVPFLNDWTSAKN